MGDSITTDGDAPAADPLEVPSALTSRQRRTTRLCLTALGVLGTGSMAGVASSLYLVNHYPLLLIALSPLGRHMILVAPIVDPFAFVAVLVGRRLLFYLASFHLGRALGPLGIPWIEARAARFGRFVRWMERLFARASHAVVLGMAGPTVSVLAGISGMRATVFVPLATLSLVVRALLVLGFAAWIREYIEVALAWIDEYWIPGTVVMVALVAVYRWRRRAPSRVMED
jgi:membrane protein DedA with SNARE-associated domain